MYPLSSSSRLKSAWMIIGLAACCLAGALNASADEVEFDIGCGDPNTPWVAKPIAYGEHTSGCATHAVTESHTFAFDGAAGDRVLFSLRSTSNGIDPLLTCKGPAPGFETLFSKYCSGTYKCTVQQEQVLDTAGTHTCTVSDFNLDETGSYRFQIERLLPTHSPLTVAYDAPETGQVNPSTDWDRFNFYGEVGTRVRINLRGTTNGLDPRLIVRDPTGDPAAIVSIDQYCSGTYKCTVSAELAVGTTGFHALYVSDLNSDESGSYEFSLVCLVGPCDSDGVAPPDPNAPFVVYDDPNQATIGSVTPWDAYAFNADPNTRVMLQVRGLSNGFDPHVTVRTPLSGPMDAIPFFDSYCSGTYKCTVQDELEPSESGLYSLFVADHGSDETGSYEYSLVCLWGACDGDGDGFVDPPPPLLTYDVVESGSLDSVTDWKSYRFKGISGTKIRINLRGTSNGLDPRMVVRDPSGDPTSPDARDKYCSGTYKCTNWTEIDLTSSGDYLLHVSDYYADEVGSYALSVHCIEGPCDSDADGFLDRDPPVISYQVPVRGEIEPVTDWDVFVFEAEPTTQLAFSVSGLTNGVDPSVVVIDPNGAVFWSSWCSGTYKCSMSEPDRIPPLSGTYTMLISDYGDDEVGDYQINISCLGSPCNSAIVPSPVCTGGATQSCRDNCTLVSNPLQEDSENGTTLSRQPDGVGDACDNCTESMNPPITPLTFQTTTGGQLDDDADGYGNYCDADFNNIDGMINAADLALFKIASGRKRNKSTCGPSLNQPCAQFDINGVDGLINASDLFEFKRLVGTKKGKKEWKKCSTCGQPYPNPTVQCSGASCP